jgi:hypothetical protein
MHRRLAVPAIAAAALAAAVVPALAVKGGGGSASGTSASIAPATVNGASVNAGASAPRLGDTVTFAAAVPPLAGWEYPMVAVSCYQDVNGDGAVDTNMLGPDIAYSWLDHPEAGFLLGAYASIWTERGGGGAVCRADLDAYGRKGGKESTRVLATTGNWLAAG